MNNIIDEIYVVFFIQSIKIFFLALTWKGEFQISDEHKLHFYAYYKQATEGKKFDKWNFIPMFSIAIFYAQLLKGIQNLQDHLFLG